MKRRLLWLAAPVVAAHAGCIAFPAIAIALGLPAVMPICGHGMSQLLPALAPLGPYWAATLGLAGAVAVLARLRKPQARACHSVGTVVGSAYK
jgi:hypothetical protein